MHSFKKACLATLAVLLTVVLAYSFITAPYFYRSCYYFEDAGTRRELAGQIDTLITGASYVMRGVSPNVLDRELGTNSYNTAGAYQTMKGRYYLLEKELERNPVKTVIMDVSAYSLSRTRAEEGPEGDLYILGRLDSPMERVGYFLRFFTLDEYVPVWYDSMQRGVHGWMTLLRRQGPVNEPEYKGFHPIAPKPITIDPEKLDTLYHGELIPQEKDEQDIRYFERSLELCREKGIRVVLIATPISSREILHQEGLDTALGWYREYAEAYGCEFYDFNLLRDKPERYDDNDSFLDQTHLSALGAERFTQQLSELMQRTQAGEDVSDLFLDSYAEAEALILDYYGLERGAAS